MHIRTCWLSSIVKGLAHSCGYSSLSCVRSLSACLHLTKANATATLPSNGILGPEDNFHFRILLPDTQSIFDKFAWVAKGI